MDLIPLYRTFVDKYKTTGFELPGEENWLNDHFKSANRVKFDLFDRYGIIAAAGDRHLAEFMPPWYLKSPETVEAWKVRLNLISERKENQRNLF